MYKDMVASSGILITLFLTKISYLMFVGGMIKSVETNFMSQINHIVEGCS